MSLLLPLRKHLSTQDFAIKRNIAGLIMLRLAIQMQQSQKMAAQRLKMVLHCIQRGQHRLTRQKLLLIQIKQIARESGRKRMKGINNSLRMNKIKILYLNETTGLYLCLLSLLAGKENPRSHVYRDTKRILLFFLKTVIQYYLQ